MKTQDAQENVHSVSSFFCSGKLTCLKVQTKFKRTTFQSLYCVFTGVVLVNVKYLHLMVGQVESSR